MSVVNPESRAAPTRGAAFAYHRSSQLVEWLRRGNGVRLALSAVAGLCGVLIHDWGGGLIFPFTPAISLTAGLLFGWLGIAGTIAGQFLGIWITRDDPANAFVLALSFALAGATGWAIFHYVPKLGRGLPNLRSFLWTLSAGVVGGAERLRALAGPFQSGRPDGGGIDGAMGLGVGDRSPGQRRAPRAADPAPVRPLRPALDGADSGRIPG